MFGTRIKYDPNQDPFEIDTIRKLTLSDEDRKFWRELLAPYSLELRRWEDDGGAVLNEF